jgi:hypothetical protein
MLLRLSAGRVTTVLLSARARLLLAVAQLAAALVGLKVAGAELSTASGLKDFVRFLLPTPVLCGCFASAALLPRQSKAALSWA